MYKFSVGWGAMCRYSMYGYSMGRDSIYRFSVSRDAIYGFSMSRGSIRAAKAFLTSFGLICCMVGLATAQDAAVWPGSELRGDPPGVEILREDYRRFDPSVSVPVVGGSAQAGVIYAERRYLLSPGVSGLVAEVTLREGDRVAAGTPLVVLEQDIEKLEIERLEVQLRDRSLLESTRQRLVLVREQLQSAEQLFATTRSISRDELSVLRANVLALQGEIGALELDKRREAIDLRIAQARLAQRTLRAPVAGVIVQLRPQVGEWVQAGEPVVELVDPTSHYIRIHLPVAQVQALGLGQTVAFAVDDQRAEGRVRFISPVADAASGLVEVRIAFDDPDYRFRPGLKALIEL